ncbi:hypothetical protein COCVIDRAFT_112889 [Bipolaris victoriae FI3]|uniref:Uncharacterized protein n=2 Tax=Bipolaris TaxID=33194 RepID=W6XUN2_COCC2|nr:uncharacterized protein COCCADRAFT_107926 [Bipolaris zeicola 26-R-13]XP_014551429.1 hypothetical protein COCVIDRAFT_112889 [Bipolaris victoriae FI3]EUC28910.1 hypothetical protein COCCADRAFT_107926 [Bipolaris zeicola 26-R-13]
MSSIERLFARRRCYSTLPYCTGNEAGITFARPPQQLPTCALTCERHRPPWQRK